METDQVLEPKEEVGERVVKVRFSREGGLEHLVRELHLGNKFVLSFPARVTLVDDELVFEFAMNIGVDPHPGLHLSVSFDLPVKLPQKPVEIEEVDPPPLPISNKGLLRQEIVKAGGNPEEIITSEMTEEKAKEVLDALQSLA